MQHKHYQEEKLLLSIVARDWDAVDIRTLQEDVDDKKAELETLLYVGYIRHVYTTILSIPRMQIKYILAFVCVCLLLRQ